MRGPSPPPPVDQSQPDLIPVRTGEQMDWSRLLSYLKGHIDGLGDHYEVEQFGGGHANLTYRFVSGEVELVVRRPPLGPVAKGAHDMGREFKVLSRLYRGYPQAPKAYHFCDDPSVIGAPFFIAERRHGIVVRREWPQVLHEQPQLERRVSFALIDALADLHALDPDELGLGDLGRPTGFVERQLKGWAARWHAAKDNEIPEFDEVHKNLTQKMPASTVISVLHNDYKLDNCQFQPHNPDQVYSVFDWDMATLGDPLVDLGTLLNYWPAEGGIYSWDRCPPFLREPYPPRAELVERYAQRTGFDVERINWYEAFARWKTAVVVQQIYIRFLRGQTDDQRFANYGQFAQPLIESAGQLLAR